MIDDFLIDPVLGARVIFGVHLDAFQAAGLKIAWWYPWFLDCSGLGTGKTFSRGFLPVALRCVLMEGEFWCVLYQTYESGKGNFWNYFRDYADAREYPIWNAQLGKVDYQGDYDGKDNTRGPASSKQWFKNDAQIMMVAPDWVREARAIAGLNFSGILLDEWTKSQAMTKKGESVSGIDKQVLGRVRKESFNQYHRLWTNHRIFLATAEAPSHPGYERYKTFKREVDAGNPDFGMFTSSFKDFSQRPSRNGKPFRDVVPKWTMLKGNKASWTRAHWLREALGVWARETTGVYTEAALNRCVEAGAAAGLEPECVRHPAYPDARYFMGVDSAPAQSNRADDGALAILRLRPKPGLGGPPTSNHGDWLWEFVWAYRVRGNLKRIAKDAESGALYARTLGHWSGLIHTKNQHFHLDGVELDPGAGGGGSLLLPELENTRQLINGIETEVTPLADPFETTAGNAQFIVRLFMRREMTELWPILKGDDNLIDAAHTAYEEKIEHALIQWPLPYNERPKAVTAEWELERQWALKNLDAMRAQLMQVAVERNDDGSWRLTQNHARRFSVPNGKKDLAYAGLMAFVRALLWLKLGGLDDDDRSGDAGFYVM